MLRQRVKERNKIMEDHKLTIEEKNEISDTTEKQAKSKGKFADVLLAIDEEGFDYAFRNLHDFAEVKDEKFHQLRLAYVAAADALQDYVGKGE
jgi:predicted nucleic-acid-binding protein